MAQPQEETQSVYTRRKRLIHIFRSACDERLPFAEYRVTSGSKLRVAHFCPDNKLVAPGPAHLGTWETNDLRLREVDDHSQDRSRHTPLLPGGILPHVESPRYLQRTGSPMSIVRKSTVGAPPHPELVFRSHERDQPRQSCVPLVPASQHFLEVLCRSFPALPHNPK
jgi:hypothetical protein